MAGMSLIFIPSAAVGHLTSTIEIAKILLSRDPTLSITFLIIRRPNSTSPLTSITIASANASDRLRFLYVPNEASDANADRLIFVPSKKPAVKKMVTEITESGPRLAGFVVDMLCTAMIDVAAELGVPCYTYITSGASFLALQLHLQKLCDDGLDADEFEDCDMELSLPGFSNSIPVRLLPFVGFDKKSGFTAMFIDMARNYRRTDGILVNSFTELESHAVESIASDPAVPPVYCIGPVVKVMNADSSKPEKEAEIMEWLDGHPPSSVVFLCFGSMGAFGREQVQEIARGLESSSCRFLWSLRRPPPSGQAMFAPPEEYEDFSEVLPGGFLERTAGVGKVIGWAPQTAVLAHPSVGGFVSHCGWNSTLESLWFGVPIATWPLYAEQQLNAFEAVKETGIGVEISLDYRALMGQPGLEKAEIVSGEQVERGIRQLMQEESEVRKKVKLMMDKCREAVGEGGSSYNSLQQFISGLRNNIGT